MEKKELKGSQLVTAKAMARSILPVRKRFIQAETKSKEWKEQAESLKKEIQRIEAHVFSWTDGWTVEEILGEVPSESPAIINENPSLEEIAEIGKQALSQLEVPTDESIELEPGVVSFDGPDLSSPFNN